LKRDVNIKKRPTQETHCQGESAFPSARAVRYSKYVEYVKRKPDKLKVVLQKRPIKKKRDWQK